MDMVVLVYVDDMAIAVTQMLVWFKTKLGKLFQISESGELKHILGIWVWHNHKSQMIQLDQTTYIQGLLSHHGMNNSTPVAMPAAVKDCLTTLHCPSSPTEKKSYNRFTAGFWYLECLGSVLYAMHTHPDIQYATCVCTLFGSNPGKPHLVALKQIL